MSNTKSGYTAILGLPNSGKSTLLNSLLGQKLSIITSKPQTTRKRILGILTETNYQIVFLDTPGILKPNYLLQEKMIEEIELSIKDADVFILMIDVGDDKNIDKTFNNKIVNEILKFNKPKILVLNKIDLITQERVNELLTSLNKENNFNEVIPFSATLNFNKEKLINEIVDHLPEGEKFYPDDIVADDTERFFVSEIIREKIFELYRDEIPYSTEVLIRDFKERENSKDYISVDVVIEKESQKAIIIGKQGAAIKKLGEEARKSIEEFLQKEVYLELHVKVRSNWRSNENFLKSFGYTRKKD